jgi:microcystin-dependent protein
MSLAIPSQQDTGTLITNTLWNELVDGVAHFLGMKADGDTLANTAAGKTLGWDIGDVKASTRRTDIDNAWLRCDGRTIGSAASSATARANADMEALFTHLWTEFTDSELPIYTNGGASSSRGASAAADWAANKRMSLPDMRGRALVGMDDPTGSDAADRVTGAWADAMGGSAGAETHTLVTAELPSHNHSIPCSMNFNWSGATKIADGTSTDMLNTQYTGSVGSDAAHNNMQPSITCNYFIYTGN